MLMENSSSVAEDGYIVGGSEVGDATQIPFQCALFFNHAQICGCAIFENQWVMTAAHCLWYNVT